MAALETIAFDADDTLWENLSFFEQVEADVVELLTPFCEPESFRTALHAAEKANLSVYGFGIKGFVLSMIEAAVATSKGRVDARAIGDIVDAGKAMLDHPIELLPDVRETLEVLSGRYRLIVVTKGDLFHQERKIAASGLSDFFEAEQIVSEKNAAVYRRLFTAPDRTVMVGNAPRSDILPALEAGAWAVHVPHDLIWDVEEAPIAEHPRCRRIARLGELPGVLDAFEAA